MKFCKVSRYQNIEEPDPKNPGKQITRRALVPVKRHLTWDEARAACRKDRSLEIGPDSAPVEEFKEVEAATL